MQHSAENSGAGRNTVLLHIFPSFAHGGQQARLATLVNRMGPQFHHLVLSLDGALDARGLFAAGAPIEFNTYAMKKSAGFSLTNILTFRKLIARTSPDILCTYNWGSIEAAVANRMGAAKPHIHFEDGFGPDETGGNENRNRDRARRLILSRSTIVTPSHGLEDAARTRWARRADQVKRIGNGVDVDGMQVADHAKPHNIVVGSLGSLRAEKNYRRLITAFKAADSDARALLHIVGDGPERARLAAAADGDGRITLPGATSEPAKAYARFDIFALSSDTEQAPISLMEAMASGLPVVATNVGDIAKMVSPENLPFVTPPGDDEAYTHALAQMLQNPTARADIGAANRRKAKAAFPVERMVAAHRDLYRSMAGRHA